MKYKEESLTASTRGNPSSLEETTGSLSRPGRTVTASAKQPALGLFPESLVKAVVTESNSEPVFRLPLRS